MWKNIACHHLACFARYYTLSIFLPLCLFDIIICLHLSLSCSSSFARLAITQFVRDKDIWRNANFRLFSLRSHIQSLYLLWISRFNWFDMCTAERQTTIFFYFFLPKKFDRLEKKRKMPENMTHTQKKNTHTNRLFHIRVWGEGMKLDVCLCHRFYNSCSYSFFFSFHQKNSLNGK